MKNQKRKMLQVYVGILNIWIYLQQVLEVMNSQNKEWE